MDMLHLASSSFREHLPTALPWHPKLSLSLNLVLNKFNSLAEFHFKVILSLDSPSPSSFLRFPADSRGNH